MQKMRECNLVLAGVGGQGVLLLAEILGNAAVEDGFNVRVSEIHGMAQRGGAVVSDVRIGEKTLAPTILEGTADAIVGLEPMEALRSIKYASHRTVILINTAITKSGITSRRMAYPSLEAIMEKIRIFSKNIITVEATDMAKALGNATVQNIVMIGALAATGKLPLKIETIRKSIRASINEKYVEINLKAFEAGMHHNSN
ncbi:MAG TPA: indolepyruvate oxidoreductase subunit beta [Candidatus Bathyarchaeia archaeon]|nr:indolepyruvate oxidoreductase subunit beta [Candidatus Bathyarchaeia archaeon]